MLNKSIFSSRPNPIHLTREEIENIEILKSMVQDSTSDMLKSVNWQANIELVDFVNGTTSSNVLREMVDFLRKRLQSSSLRVVIYTINLTEVLVKNCSLPVHREIATEKFMNQLQKLYKNHHNNRGRDSLEISETVLDLIQTWGETFLPYKKELPLFSETYHDMRRKGVQFREQYDENKVPILTPPPSIPDEESFPTQEQTTSKRPSSSSLHRDSGIFSNIRYVGDTFKDILTALSSNEEFQTHEIIPDIYQQLKSLETKLIEKIEELAASGSTDLGEAIELHEFLQENFALYHDIKKNGVPQRKPTLQPVYQNHLDVNHLDLISTTKPISFDSTPSTSTLKKTEKTATLKHDDRGDSIPFLKPPPGYTPSSSSTNLLKPSKATLNPQKGEKSFSALNPPSVETDTLSAPVDLLGNMDDSLAFFGDDPSSQQQQQFDKLNRNASITSTSNSSSSTNNTNNNLYGFATSMTSINPTSSCDHSTFACDQSSEGLKNTSEIFSTFGDFSGQFTSLNNPNPNSLTSSASMGSSHYLKDQKIAGNPFDSPTDVTIPSPTRIDKLPLTSKNLFYESEEKKLPVGNPFDDEMDKSVLQPSNPTTLAALPTIHYQQLQHQQPQQYQLQQQQYQQYQQHQQHQYQHYQQPQPQHHNPHQIQQDKNYQLQPNASSESDHRKIETEKPQQGKHYARNLSIDDAFADLKF